MTSANYTANAPVTANGFTANSFSPDPALVAANGGGRLKTNRPDYYQNFSGIELSMIKRLSNKWMARVAFSYNDWKEHFDGPAAVENPTRNDVTGGTGGGGMPASGPQVDGGIVAPRSGGSGKGDIFYNTKWQITANALYELPANFEIGASIYGRQGFPRPIVLSLSGGNDGSIRTLGTSNLDDTKYPEPLELRPSSGQQHPAGRRAEPDHRGRAVQHLQQQRRAQPSASGHVERLRASRPRC